MCKIPQMTEEYPPCESSSDGKWWHKPKNKLKKVPEYYKNILTQQEYNIQIWDELYLAECKLAYELREWRVGIYKQKEGQ